VSASLKAIVSGLARARQRQGRPVEAVA